ncbi:hypothetical protein SK128_011769 [Halocaridina rubra]|uniref:Uncharacterized protein n=1 Tax=Halocaridina rubra TaxID=373956 RepID=A0AAN9ABG2_HALRR
MGIKGGLLNAFTSVGNFQEDDSIIAQLARRSDDRCHVFLDCNSLFFVNFLNWDQHDPDVIDQEINNYIKKMHRLMGVSFHDLAIFLVFDDPQGRPLNKEKRKTTTSIYAQVNTYKEYLADHIHEAFYPFDVFLYKPDTNQTGYCGESDYQIMNAVSEEEDGSFCSVIGTSDSDFLAFKYYTDTPVYLYSQRRNKIFNLKDFSSTMRYALLAAMAIAGCDYGNPLIKGKDKSEIGKVLRDTFTPNLILKDLSVLNIKMTSEVFYMTDLGLDAFAKENPMYCPNIRVLEKFIDYIYSLYLYYNDGVPFTSDCEYFNYKICRRDAYYCIIMFLYYHARGAHDCVQKVKLLLNKHHRHQPVPSVWISSTLVRGGGEQQPPAGEEQPAAAAGDINRRIHVAV